jgi:hypothetical protein
MRPAMMLSVCIRLQMSKDDGGSGREQGSWTNAKRAREEEKDHHEDIGRMFKHICNSAQVCRITEFVAEWQL